MSWLRRITVLLVGVVLLGAVAACTWQGLKPDEAGMQRLYITGDPAHVTDRQIIAATAGRLDSGFFELDIDGLRDAVVSLPWVASAQVQRRWPNGLVVRVREHRPLALWGDGAVLAADGSFFRPAEDERPENLPTLDGPEGTRSKVQQALPKLRGALAPMDARIARLELSARGAWAVTLASGLELRLGRNDIYSRVARFATRGPSAIGDALSSAAYVDLRYVNGFVVGGKRTAPDEASKEAKDEQAA